MIDDKILSMLRLAINSDEVYPDIVPESAEKPAIAFVHAADAHERLLDGNKTTRFSVWRLTLVAKTKSELQSLIDKLESIDNTRNSDFLRIFADLILRSSKEPDAPFRTAFVDLTVYY